jgi:hypothetical protein
MLGLKAQQYLFFGQYSRRRWNTGANAIMILNPYFTGLLGRLGLCPSLCFTTWTGTEKGETDLAYYTRPLVRLVKNLIGQVCRRLLICLFALVTKRPYAPFNKTFLD